MGLFARKTVAPAAPQGEAATAGWRCAVLVPNARTNTRAACGTTNEANDARCRECGASRALSMSTETDNTKNADKNRNKENSMSNETVKPANKTTTSNQSKSHSAPAAAPHKASPTPAHGSPQLVTSEAGKSDVKETNGSKPERVTDVNNPESFKGLPRLKFYSTAAGKEEYCARVLPFFVEKYGAPKDPWGNEMKLRPGQDPTAKPKKVARLEAKEAEEKKLATMTDDEKMAYAKAKREQNQKIAAAKKEEKRAKMLAEVKAQLERDGMVIVPKAQAPSA